MYLDETILQSRTTLTLVEYIDEMWILINHGIIEFEVIDAEDFMRIERKYHDIKGKANRANRKRSFPIR